MDKNVALDPHGNPLPEEEVVDGEVALETGYRSELQRLTEDVDEHADEDDEPEVERVSTQIFFERIRLSSCVHQKESEDPHSNGQLLFSVDDDEGSEPDDHPPKPERTNSLPPPYAEEDPTHSQQVWREDR